MAVNDWYEVTTDMSVQGEHCYNVFNFRETVGAGGDVPAQDLADAFDAAITADWAALLSNLTTLNCYYARRISPAPGVAYTKIVNEQGAVAGDPLPTTSAALLSWYGLTAGPRTRGRSYMAGLPEAVQSGGLLEDAAQIALEAFADLLKTPVVGGGTWELGIWSRVNLAGIDAKVRVVRSNLATMRSRRQRPGAA